MVCNHTKPSNIILTLGQNNPLSWVVKLLRWFYMDPNWINFDPVSSALCPDQYKIQLPLICLHVCLAKSPIPSLFTIVGIKKNEKNSTNSPLHLKKIPVLQHL